jgi:hypothetical protein
MSTPPGVSDLLRLDWRFSLRSVAILAMQLLLAYASPLILSFPRDHVPVTSHASVQAGRVRTISFDPGKHAGFQRHITWVSLQRCFVPVPSQSLSFHDPRALPRLFFPPLKTPFLPCQQACKPNPVHSFNHWRSLQAFFAPSLFTLVPPIRPSFFPPRSNSRCPAFSASSFSVLPVSWLDALCLIFCWDARFAFFGLMTRLPRCGPVGLRIGGLVVWVGRKRGEVLLGCGGFAAGFDGALGHCCC